MINQNQLFVELIVAIGTGLVREDADKRSFYNQSQSELEHAVCFLCEHGCAFPCSQDGSPTSEPTATFIVERPNVARDKLASASVKSRFDVYEALWAYLFNGARGGFEIARRTVQVDDKHHRLVKALADNGFGQFANGHFKWSSKIDPLCWSTGMWGIREDGELPVVNRYLEANLPAKADIFAYALLRVESVSCSIEEALKQALAIGYSFGVWFSKEDSKGKSLNCEYADPLISYAVDGLKPQFLDSHPKLK